MLVTRVLLGAAVAFALLAAPASAQVAPAYTLSLAGGVLTAQNGSTLAVSAAGAGADIVYTPEAAAFPGAICSDTGNSTTCTPAPGTNLAFAAPALAVNVTTVNTPLLSFTGGASSDSIVVADSAASQVVLTPGAGNALVRIAGTVNLFTLAADPGDDRYVINTAVPLAQTLNFDTGNDVVSSTDQLLTLQGGDGDDTLSGRGRLEGGPGADLLKPTETGRAVQGDGGNDHLSYDLLGADLTLTKSGTTISGDGPDKNGIELLTGGTGNDRLTGTGQADALLAGGEGNDTIAGGGGGDNLDGGAGSNILSYASSTADVNVDLAAGTAATAGSNDALSGFRTVETGAGSDVVTGTTGDERFTLGGGDDRVNAAPGNDAIDGGPGNDLIRGGQGTDSIDGGGGTDTATYDERTPSEPLALTLASQGDDGAPGENDTLAGIENLVGGASNDVMTGDDGPNSLVGGSGVNTIDGAGGNDVLVGGDFRDIIVGGPGLDHLIGAGDDDSLNAYDSEADVVSCGPSADDDAQVDGADQVDGCEFSRRGDVPVPVDADNDGSVAGADCNDANAAINLGARDVPGDGIDQNCDDFDEQLPLATGGFALAYRPVGRGTRITRLVVTDLVAGSRVAVTCKSPARRGCPFGRADRRLRGAATQIPLTSALRRRVLPAGTTLELRISAPGTIGKVRRFTIRRGSAPRSQDLCLMPRTTVARKCPADVG